MNTKTTNTNTLPRLAVGQCPVCGSAGSLVHFHGEAFPVVVGDLSGSVGDLSGDRCQVCEEVFFDDSSAQRFADAGDALVMQSRKEEGAHLKAMRKRLGLTQGEVGLLVGGGHNGVSRYESGQSDPGPAAFNLLHLLDKNPLLAGELPGVVVTKINTKTFRHHLHERMGAKGAMALSAKGQKGGKTVKPNKVITVAGQQVVINVDASAVLGTVSRAGKRHVAGSKVKQVDVGRLVAARAAAERPVGQSKRNAAAKSAVAKKSR
ncbi:type II toxin-antitoxin system MqsA family antitoxin [Stenotrophomonas maltophilia]